MKKGFTLVELSIVLVIVGLLIGGILVAQSMIGSAKIVAVAGQIQQFDAGVTSFKAKTDYLPGDSKLNPLGNGDGWVASGTGWGNGTQINIFWGEAGIFWWDLDPLRFPGPNSPTPPWNNAAQPSGPTPNVPASKLGTTGSFFVVTAMGNDADEPLARGLNYYFILDGRQTKDNNGGGLYRYYATTVNGYTNSATTPSEALALDKKLDDGIANTGDVISAGIIVDWNDNGTYYGALSTTPNSSCSSGATYLVTNKTTVCTPAIRVGSQVGDPS